MVIRRSVYRLSLIRHSVVRPSVVQSLYFWSIFFLFLHLHFCYIFYLQQNLAEYILSGGHAHVIQTHIFLHTDYLEFGVDISCLLTRNDLRYKKKETHKHLTK